MSFELLSNKLQDTVKKARFGKPTLPQELGIPPIKEGKNILLIAPTGLGKTEACMLGIFDMWMEKKPKPISILYLTPLKSLNRDLLRRFEWWSQELDLNVSVRHGDTTQYERKKQVEFPDDLLVSTPETLQAILPAKKMREHLKNVKFVICDEIHELADSKRGTQLTIALERLRQLCGDFQLIALSATVGSPELVAKYISGGRQMEIVKATTSKGMNIEVISPRSIASDNELSEKIGGNKSIAARLRVVHDLMKQHASTLTFTNTRDFAEILTSRLKHAYSGFPVENHHSSLGKSVRIKVEEDFKKQELKSIVCTSSLELGIDIGSIDFILHYMSPRQPARAIQRIGRSGHEYHRTSEGVVIATDIDDLFESAVIARQALSENLQAPRMHENALDVLAHQIVGLTRDKYKTTVDEAYDIVRHAYPYRSLTKQQFLNVCKQLNQLHYIFLDDNNIKASRKGLFYYFENLSTIPDTKNYAIVNMINNERVGTLDEEFVAIQGTEGSTFIIKGEPWHIVSVEDKKIYVEPSGDVDAAIPGWEGDLMPVPFDVTQEVGALRGIIADMLNKGYDRNMVLNEIRKRYPVDGNSARRMITLVKKQMKYGIPTDKRILAEVKDNVIVLHTCFGTMVNETLGRFLSALITARAGSVGLKTDPYRIILQLQRMDLDLVRELLFKTKPDSIEPFLEIAIRNTKLFQWKFLHVAKRFGVFRKDASFDKIRVDKIIDIYSNTPVWDETFREIKTEKLDIERAAEILEKIQKGKIDFVIKSSVSPLAKVGLKQRQELVGPEKPELQILELFEKRLMDKKVRLVCINCGKWAITMKVKEVPKEIKCSNCRAKLITVINPHRPELEKIIQKRLKDQSLTVDEKHRWERMSKISDLVIVYGRKAVIALATRGVGPQTASRVLRGFYRDEQDFLEALLNAERQFIKTKKFWG